MIKNPINEIKVKIAGKAGEKVSNKTEIVGFCLPEHKIERDGKFCYTIEFYFKDFDSNKTYRVDMFVEEDGNALENKDKRKIQVSGYEAPIEYKNINFLAKPHTDHSKIDEKSLRMIQDVYEIVYGKRKAETPSCKFFETKVMDDIKNIVIPVEEFLEFHQGDISSEKDIEMIIKNSELFDEIDKAFPDPWDRKEDELELEERE